MSLRDQIPHHVTFIGNRHRPSEAVPAAPSGPVRVIDLPTPEWPAPSAPRPSDGFAERRRQLARQRAAEVWFERHPGDRRTAR